MKAVIIVILLGFPTQAFALVPHDYPALYTNIVGRIFFLVSCLIVIAYLRKNRLHTALGWRQIHHSLIFFNLWNLNMLFARSSELWIIGEMDGLKYLEQQVFISDLKDYLLYIANFDYALLNIAMLMFYMGLKRIHWANTGAEQTNLTVMLPYFPIILFDIVGSLIFLTLSYLCFRESLRLYKMDRENIIWNYMTWLTASYALYALSRTTGYILRHWFLALDLQHLMSLIEPYAGSINTLTFIWLGTISLFFLRIYPIYLRLSEAKKKIEEINADVISLNKEIEDLVAERTMAILGLSVADKVRNPVAIIGCICKRLLNKEKLSDKVAENLRDVVEECRKLEVIVNDFEGILKNRQRMFQYLDINDIVRDIAIMMQEEIKQKGVNLELRLAESPVCMNVQKNLIRAGLFHLLKNALDATESGGTIRIVTKTINNNVLIEIGDTGSGIPAENLQRIFDPFFSTRQNRIGMGLPLVKQIVAEHLGDIRVSSEIGKGTTFELEFPVKWCVIADNVRREVGNGFKG